MRALRAFSLASLSLLAAACGSHGGGQPAAPQAAIESDIAATPPGKILAEAPEGAPPPEAAPAETPPGGVTASPTEPLPPGDRGKGRSFALDNCRPCHVVAADQRSPVRFANAPDFRSIANAPQTTPLRLNTWLTNPHPTMPSLRLNPAEAADVIAYIMSLKG
jgi:mono/diheme cytochrome c family protein